MNNDDKVAVIGHVDHSKTALTAAIVTVLSNRNIQQQMDNTMLEIPYKAHDPEMYIPTQVEAYQGKRIYKPNKGITIGTYKYKSNKNK